MIQLKIKVTKEILERSKMCTPTYAATNCAIALAIRDMFPHASVDGDTILFDTMYPDIEEELPIEAKIFITSFDLNRPEHRIFMQPIEFEISIPDEVLEKINIDEVRQLLVNHPTLELV